MAGEETEIRQLSRYLDWVGRLQKPGDGGKFLLRTTGSSGAAYETRGGQHVEREGSRLEVRGAPHFGGEEAGGFGGCKEVEGVPRRVEACMESPGQMKDWE